MEIHNNFQDIIDKYPAIISEIDNDALMAYANEVAIPNAKSEIDQMAELTNYICQTQGIDRKALSSKSRGQYLTQARFIIWWCVRNQVFKNRISFSVIGNLFSKNHSTVLYGVRTMDNLIYHDVELRHELMRVINHFNRSARWDDKRKRLDII